MATLLERVENYTGTVSDATAVDTWVVEAAAKLIDLLPPHKAEKVAQPIDYVADLDVTSYRVLFMLDASNKFCRKADVATLDGAVDADSIYYSPVSDPVYWILNGELNSTATDGTVYALLYPSSVDSSTATSILGFPDELLELVALDASMKEIQGRIGTLQGKITTAVDAQIALALDLSAQYATLATYLDTEEDIELAQTKMQEIQVRIAEHQAQIQQYSIEIQAIAGQVNVYVTQIGTLKKLYDDALMLHLGIGGQKQ